MADMTDQVVEALRRMGRVATAPEVAKEWERAHGGNMHQTKAFRHLRKAVAQGRVVRDERKRWLMPEWVGDGAGDGAEGRPPMAVAGGAQGRPRQERSSRMSRAAVPLLREAISALEGEPEDPAAAEAYMDSAYTLLRARHHVA